MDSVEWQKSKINLLSTFKIEDLPNIFCRCPSLCCEEDSPKTVSGR